jgi:hypothetical protein
LHNIPAARVRPSMSAATNGNGVPQQDAQVQLNGLVQADAEKNRVAVHSFDPNASPAEKAAAAGKGRDAVKSVKAENGKANATGM